MQAVPARYRILGSLEIERDGERAMVSAGKPRAVLLALLLRPGAVTSTAVLIDSLWPAGQPAG